MYNAGANEVYRNAKSYNCSPSLRNYDYHIAFRRACRGSVRTKVVEECSTPACSDADTRESRSGLQGKAKACVDGIDRVRADELLRQRGHGK